MCRTAPRRSRCSTRWAPSRRSSPTRLCWSPPKASCPSGSAPTAHSTCEKRASSRWPCCRCWRASARRSRSSRSPSGRARADFDFAHFGRAPAHFDPHEVELLNARLLHKARFSAVADRLRRRNGSRTGCFSPNLERAVEFRGLARCRSGDIGAGAGHEERALVREGAESPQAHRLVGRALAGADRSAQTLDRPQGQGAVPHRFGWRSPGAKAGRRWPA